MHTTRFRLVASSLLWLPLLFSIGCGARLQPTAPDNGIPNALSTSNRAAQFPGDPADSPNAFYPLRSGNHWDLDRTFTVEVHPYSGPVSQVLYSSTIATDQTCNEIVDGRTYLIERAVETGPDGSYIRWFRIRQDRTELYEADLSIGDPPACEGASRSGADAEVRWAEPGGGPADLALDLISAVPSHQRTAWLAALKRDRDLRYKVGAALGLGPSSRRIGLPPSGELLRLSYPLHPGAAWVLRSEEPTEFNERVDGIDAVKTSVGTFVGYRISIRSPFLGDHDHVFVWYGRQGFLKLDAHFESLAVDDQGNVYGTVVSDELQTLIGLSLVDGPPRYAAR